MSCGGSGRMPSERSGRRRRRCAGARGSVGPTGEVAELLAARPGQSANRLLPVHQRQYHAPVQLSGICSHASGSRFPRVSRCLVAPILHECDSGGIARVQTTIANSRDGIRDLLEHVITSYQEMDGRFASVGGVGRLLGLYEQLQHELERVSYDEIDRMAAEIRRLIEALLKMDYDLRRVNNLKLAFDARHSGGASGDR